MDYGKLRAAALRDGEDEEAVTVDTRALIDKVLARYSGEWTTLRELIQNAADAQATTVKIKWETLPSTQVPLPPTTDRSEILKHVIANHTLKRLVVQNNGQPFTKTDWGRLKRIAEGNPDETKIGAFGVGFYSVFADSLQNIEFWIDDYKILHLKKKTSPSVDVALSRDVETTTKERLMKVQSVERASAQIDASFMGAIGWKPEVAATAKSEAYGSGSSEMPSLRSFFSRLTANPTTAKANKVAKEEKLAQEAISEDITTLSSSSIFLRVTTAAIKTSVTTNFSAELERATKKPPPKLAKLSVLTSSYDETQASQSSTSSTAVSKATNVFASVLPSKKGGRIFIGFPTTQTTGAGIHISAPSVIPTVEREAIDLNARWVRTWNIEMLRAAGIMTRLAFSNEMAELQIKLQRAAETSNAGITSKEVAKYMPEALHTLKAFTFGDSTPSGHVSQIIEEAFWTSYKKPFVEVYSSRGVLPTNKVRLGSEELAKFVDGIPKFGVVADPPIYECIERLLAKPPSNHQDAVSLFGYFATRLNELNGSAIVKLREALIVPVVRRKELATSRLATDKEDKAGNVVHLSPRQCYLGSSTMYGDIFDFVDFGSSANAFLSACGSKTEPTKLEIAQLAAGEPARLLSVLQSSEKYLSVLKLLAEETATLKRDKELWRKMKSSPFLLAFKEISAPAKDKTSETEEDEAPIRSYQLATPASIVILDDYISYRLFKDHLICAPEEDALEAFYMALGSQTLSAIVQEDLRVGPQSEKQDGALWLRKHVLERSKIFIHEYARYTRDAIKHDARWLEKNLTVEAVRSVSLRRSLRGQSQSHTEKRSAASLKATNGWILYVASESSRPDMYQVGQAVCQLILNRPSQQAYFFFEPFLKLDLLDLRARGYNVDRILRAKAAEARIAEEERRKALDAEQANIREREAEFRRNTQAAASRSRNRTPPPRMPGGFGSPDDSESLSPPPANTPQQQTRRSKGFFSNFSKRFGFDTSSEAEDNLRNLIESDPDPEPAKLPPAEPSTGSGSKPGKKDDGKVTNPAIIQQNLLNAIMSTRAHDSSQVYSPPTTREVKEQATYCDDTIGKDLNFVADASNGMRVFVSRTIPNLNPAQFLTNNHISINSFASILADVSDVYSINRSSLHIFYDEEGGTIAFNRDGSIFCNLRFFIQLHVENMSGQGKAAASVWWWVVLAHELAHNLVQMHNADHSYYTESFIQQYFPVMMVKVTRLLESEPAPPANERPLLPTLPGPSTAPPPPYREH
ncbi:putative hatpase c domain-containing protein [Daldinia childiae]|uniref:putative hatpase c domain-containing protein n=1 Tax=Daldinia childiae TaxID=326645 RepID=UPI00144697F5|nr:putative hatpase c domain-containing protein [Daldinia childiae]KAF3063881.1 putative hatpase c domain-containing protein [Daldinia childiae]